MPGRPLDVGPVEEMHTRQLNALLKVSGALAESLDVRVVMQSAIEGAVDVLQLQTGAIYLVDGEEIYLGATTPALPPDFPERFRHARLEDHPHIRASFEQANPLRIDDVTTVDMSPSESGIIEARGIASMMFVPLLDNGTPVGSFIVGTTDGPRQYTEEDSRLCRTLSHQISLALANARLFASLRQAHDELVQAYDATLDGWSRTLELRDRATGSHAERAVALTMRLASDLGISGEELENVRRGTLLHDIGKMVVPDAILGKQGPLTDEEWAIMREHPERARELLSSIEYLQPAMDIPYSHHERWDGTGYPQGLRGEEIPLAARVFAVVDVYDALTSDRPYRGAWAKSAALAYIEEQAGRQFDPQVVEAFLIAMDGSGW